MKYIASTGAQRKLMLMLCAMLLCTVGYGQSSTYMVKKGETLYSIAKEHGVTVAVLKKANPKIGAKYVVKEGQKLVIPASAGQPVAVEKPDTNDKPVAPKKSIAKTEAKTSTTTSTTATVPVATENFPEATRGYHTVGTKETLISIAHDFGVSVENLKKWNDVPNGIKPGMKLKVFDL